MSLCNAGPLFSPGEMKGDCYGYGSGPAFPAVPIWLPLTAGRIALSLVASNNNKE